MSMRFVFSWVKGVDLVSDACVNMKFGGEIGGMSGGRERLVKVYL